MRNNGLPAHKTRCHTGRAEAYTIRLKTDRNISLYLANVFFKS